MMDYYERRKKGLDLMVEGINKGDSRETIIFKLGMKLGLGEAFYEKNIKIIEHAIKEVE